MRKIFLLILSFFLCLTANADPIRYDNAPLAFRDSSGNVAYPYEVDVSAYSGSGGVISLDPSIYSASGWTRSSDNTVYTTSPTSYVGIGLNHPTSPLDVNGGMEAGVLSSLSFDGTVAGGDDYVTIPNSATGNQISGSNSVSFEVWFLAEGLGETSLGTMLSKATASNRHSIRVNAGNTLVSTFVASTLTRTSVSSTAYTSGVWNHVIVTLLVGSSAKIYLNGTEVSYTTQASVASLDDDSANPLLLGNISAGDRAFDGSIRRIRQFKEKILSPAEVAALYNNGKYVQNELSSDRGVTGATAEYNFAEGQGTVLTDSIAGNNGTLVNGPLWQNQGLTVASTGNVGVGTVDPKAVLSVMSVTGGNTIASFGVNGSSSVVVDKDGRVGIGTTSIGNSILSIKSTGLNTVPLYVYSSTGAALFTTNESASGNGQFSVYSSGGSEKVRLSTSFYSYFTGGNLGIGIATPDATLYANGTIVGVSYGNTLDRTPDATMELVKNGTTDLLDLSSLATADGDMFTVKNSGKVGIGTNNPQADFTMMASVGDTIAQFGVAGSTSVVIDRNGRLILGGTTASSSSPLVIKAYPSNGNGIIVRESDDGQIALTLQGSTSSGSINFFTGGLLNTVISANPATATYFNSGNNLGIGTTAPEQTLAVTGTSRFGSISNNTTFEADGTMVMNGSATVYNDIIINAANLRGGASAPTWNIFTGNIRQASFLNVNSDLVYGSFELPHGYMEGTPLETHIHWSPSDTNTGAMAMTFEYTFATMGTGTFGTPVTMSCSQAGSGTALQHQYLSCGIIPGIGRKIGDVFTFVLTRPTGDAYSGDAFVHDVGIHYAQDTIGSRTGTAK